jgi:hypothetical protein
MVTDGWVSIDPADEAIIEGVYKKNLREGEERLMLAVLESAVEDFQKYVLARNVSGKKLFQQAEEWFLEKNSDELFSFGSVCDTLGLHPDHLRRGLLAWTESKQKVDAKDVVKPEAQRRTKLNRTRHLPRTYRLAKAG